MSWRDKLIEDCVAWLRAARLRLRGHVRLPRPRARCGPDHAANSTWWGNVTAAIAEALNARGSLRRAAGSGTGRRFATFMRPPGSFRGVGPLLA